MKEYLKQIKIILILLLVLVGISLISIDSSETLSSTQENANVNELEASVIPEEGVELPITWDDLGKRMVSNGVIDKEKFEAIYENRGGLTSEEQNMLDGTSNEKVVMTMDNAHFLLNMLWAFGLSNKNAILEEGEMTDARYGSDASRFASTGGWTLSSGNAMDHYSRHEFVVLTDEQQKKVARVSKGIYRPCCGNSTHFPDCNHGMAMLGLLQLLAVEDLPESEMYDMALAVNSYWFPDTYMTLAKYFNEKEGVSWNNVNSEKVLGAEFSSAQGYRNILNQITPAGNQGGNGCSV